MRVNQLIESIEPQEERDPFEKYVPTPAEQATYDKLGKKVTAYRKQRLERKIEKWYEGDKLKQVTSKNKLRPGQREVWYKGKRHFINTQDPKEVEELFKHLKKYSAATEELLGDTDSVRQIALASRTTRARNPKWDAVVLAKAKAIATGINKNDKERAYVIEYISNTVSTPWPELEPYVLKKFSLMREYWKCAYHHRAWLDYENTLIRSLPTQQTDAGVKIVESDALAYMKRVKGKHWPALEQVLMRVGTKDGRVAFAKQVGQRLGWVEQTILTNLNNGKYSPDSSVFDYMDAMRMKAWPEFEQTMFRYRADNTIAKYLTIRGPWAAGEQIVYASLLNGTLQDFAVNRLLEFLTKNNKIPPESILSALATHNNIHNFVDYVIGVVKRRVPAFEKRVESNQTSVAQYYRKNYADAFLGGKWPLGGV